jgi:hypothetical protein
MNFETCAEIESAVAVYFCPRRNLIVPNVWWGLELNHECDLFVLNQAGFAYEVEIKTSRADIKADLKKRNWHSSTKIRRLYFAIPGKLESSVNLIPESAGVLIVGTTGGVKKLREAKLNKDARQLTDREKIKLGHLAAMRIWPLKNAVRRLAAMKSVPILETFDYDPT